MNYGFVIDARKCIGCHACTVACKSENEVPLGVNRTWVKYVEKGSFPNTRRHFTVLRCNHCEEPPCVDICPVEALHRREDGIVDFDARRCIGCKACGQACPYGALYIDPETKTSAKCNYCAHRKEVGLKPACVAICPQQAIVSGDLDDPSSPISLLVSTEKTMVRRPEKGTRPKLFYINGDGASLDPMMAPPAQAYHWSSQSRGVGHFAKYCLDGDSSHHGAPAQQPPQAIKGSSTFARRVYDAPSKGAVWGWEVPAYVWSKAVSAGTFLLLFVLTAVMGLSLPDTLQWAAWGVSLLFLSLTGGLLVKDLDRPDRFVSVMLRPQFGSWLVRGGYTITGFGAFLALWGAGRFFALPAVETAALWGGALLALVTAVYTAFLFGSAKGRDFWQSPLLSLHMLVNSLIAGGSAMALAGFATGMDEAVAGAVRMLLAVSFVLHLAIMGVELYGKHPSASSGRAADIIRHGALRQQFWGGSVVMGNLLPLLAALVSPDPALLALAALLGLAGVFFTEKVWVLAPQSVPLS
ncbi:MAG: polysulfide reductase NrfD [Chlorobiaceae bacterium]|nr:polysulfide reductase NrfD [Chlorobiaceae bacterium]NTW73282.1 polysulfide reductase NrfD [Chlorobiaceae bacterium]